MERDDGAMGYVTSDVVSLNAVFERFLTLDDSQFMASELYAYAYYKSLPSTKVKSRLPPRKSVLKYAGDVPLFEDNPRKFVREDDTDTFIAAGPRAPK